VISEIQLLSVLSDSKSLALLEIITIKNSVNREGAMKQLRLTEKQYHSRISGLMKCGLIERRNGRYYITSLGEVVHELLRVMRLGIEYYWVLKAIDSIKHELPEKERNKIIRSIIDKQEIKELLLRRKEDESYS